MKTFFPSSPRPVRTRKLLATALVTGGCMATVAAHAQDVPSPPSLFGEKTEVIVGLGAGVIPRYLGAKDSKVLPVPTVAMYRGIFFADSVRGLGAEYMTESGFYVSSALSYDFGRTEKDSDWRPGSKKLAGMGEIKSSTVINVLAAQQLTSWLAVNAEANFRVAGQRDRGNNYRLGLESTVFDDAQDTITVGMNVHAADRDYTQTYFGVTQAQSQRSRFSHFTPKSGIYAYSLTADWSHDFNKHWTLFAAVNVMQFSERAKDSPVVEEKAGVTGTVMLNYSF
ncbi:MipA/OmpV family protein (plasmid) [Pantoea agglomerans]|uniref:MipA/OmpV family protein n=1 Tax=Enterobacter agglomerans TaxID=549 RepID=UPI00289D2CE3|nr:MipA/OmpV family protein [Pantoea agglomerans]WNK51258.1 MipA/OmpV family protein [Pantoea agglomerans]